jgi:transposase
LVAEAIDTDPRTLGYHQTAWTAPLLACYLRDRHEIDVSRRTVSRAIARLGIRWKRPRHQLARRPDTWRQSKDTSDRVNSPATTKAPMSDPRQPAPLMARTHS